MAAVQWQRDHSWIDAVVEPWSGWHVSAEGERLDSEQFQLFLHTRSVELGEEIALMELDQAKAHQALS